MPRLPSLRRHHDAEVDAAVEVRRRLSTLMSRLGVPAEAQDVLFAVAEVMSEEISGLLAADGFDAAGRWRSWARLRALSAHTRQVLTDLKGLVEASEQLAIAAGTHWPLPGQREWLESAVGGSVSFAATLSEEVATFGSGALSIGAAIAATPVLQALETYLAASARANVYRRNDLGYDRDLIAADLHAAVTGGTVGCSRSVGARQMITELGDWAVERAASQIWQVFAIGVGAAWAAAGTVRVVRRVSVLPLQATGQQTPAPSPAPERQLMVDWLRTWRTWGPEVPALPVG